MYNCTIRIWILHDKKSVPNDVILKSMRRQSAVSASILLRLVHRAKEPMSVFPQSSKISSNVIKRRNIDVDAT